MTERKILVIEDDPEVVEIVRQACQTELPHTVDDAREGRLGLELARTGGYELIVMDITLPDIRGFEICKSLRQEGILAPVVCLTSRTGEVDKVLALELGADDYVAKPFSPRELVARIKAALRRASEYSDAARDSLPKRAGRGDVIRIGEIEIDLGRRELLKAGKSVDLSRTEFDLIALLAENAGSVVSRDQILEEILGYDAELYDPVVTSHISRTRAKIETNPASPTYILTSRGVGYRFVTAEELKRGQK